MVFIGAKGQRRCVDVRLQTLREEAAGVLLVRLRRLFKNAPPSTAGARDPLGVNLLSGKYQVTWLMIFHISRTFQLLQ